MNAAHPTHKLPGGHDESGRPSLTLMEQPALGAEAGNSNSVFDAAINSDLDSAPSKHPEPKAAEIRGVTWDRLSPAASPAAMNYFSVKLAVQVGLRRTSSDPDSARPREPLAQRPGASLRYELLQGDLLPPTAQMTPAACAAISPKVAGRRDAALLAPLCPPRLGPIAAADFYK